MIMLSKFDSLDRKAIRIRRVEMTEDSHGSTVRASVSGKSIWFSVEGLRLRPDPIAFLLAYHLAARKLNRSLSFDQPIDLQGLPRLGDAVTLTDDWWQLGSAPVLCSGEGPTLHPAEGRRTGLFFSCGMDSFDAVLGRRDEVDDLVLVHGYDVALAEEARFAALRSRAQTIADQLGKRLIVLRTNLREHRLFQKGSWVRNHGSALAAVGHLLAGEFDRLLIAGSYPSRALVPWGSHPLLDHLWSSSTLKIEHVGDERWRLEKIERFGANPLVQAHLSVCWKGSGLPVNCGTCEKCVRNQLGFLLCAHRIPASFPKGLDIAMALRSIPSLKVVSSVYQMATTSDRIPERIRAEVVALLDRSPHLPDGRISKADHWDAPTVEARIQSQSSRRRFEGGSPNPAEIEVYAKYLPVETPDSPGTAIVLGMTPELRALAAGRFERLLTVDSGKAAIERYRSWLEPEQAEREKVYSIDWRHLPYVDQSAFPPVRAILGDGIFGNLPDETAHRVLLQSLRASFPRAVLVFRKALAKPVGASDEAVREGLQADFRSGRIGADEFGFSVRLQGFLNTHYHEESAILDNAALFKDCDRLARDGFFNPEEVEAIRRFRYEGPNCLLTEERWEALLSNAGLPFEKTVLSGKRWYDFYPIYAITPGAS